MRGFDKPKRGGQRGNKNAAKQTLQGPLPSSPMHTAVEDEPNQAEDEAARAVGTALRGLRGLNSLPPSHQPLTALMQHDSAEKENKAVKSTIWPGNGINASITSIPRLVMIAQSSHLTTVNCSGLSFLVCIESLSFAPLIEHLDISGTSVACIKVVALLTLLKKFNCSRTPLDDIFALRSCNLVELDISYTLVTQLYHRSRGKDHPFFALRGSVLTLKILNCRGTQIQHYDWQHLTDINCRLDELDVRDCPNLYKQRYIEYFYSAPAPAYWLTLEKPPYLQPPPLVLKYNGPMTYMLMGPGSEDVDCSDCPNLKRACGSGYTNTCASSLGFYRRKLYPGYTGYIHYDSPPGYPKHPNLGYISVCGSHLKRLSLRNCPVLKDISDIRFCRQLQWLDLSNTAIKDVTQLTRKSLLPWGDPSRWTGCFLLEYLDIQRTRVTSVISLKECKELKSLHCSFIVVDVAALKEELPNLVVKVQQRSKPRSRVIVDDIDDDDNDEAEAMDKAKARKLSRQDRERALEMEELQRQFSRCQPSSNDGGSNSSSEKNSDDENPFDSRFNPI